MERKEQGVSKTLPTLLIILFMALLSTSDIMELIPFFHPFTSSTILPYVSGIEYLLTLSLALWAAYRYSTKELGKGTGLGLSICQGIIAEHGGRIGAESEPGRGHIQGIITGMDDC